MRVRFPKKLESLFTPAPYKVVYGGRGKGASWGFARAALILGSHKKLFIVCAREVQKSIRDSVHKLLSDQIVELGYGPRKDEHGNGVPAFYEVLDAEIRGVNGTVIVFVGLNNIGSIKSMEGIDIFWLTEAVHVPKSKWLIIEPTVRRDPPFGPFRQGSEIWIDLNPELTSDDTYQRYVVDPPTGAITIEMNYRDNPFFPAILRKQMEDMRAKDRDEYLTVFEGKTRKALAGAIFAKEIEAGILAGRIGPHIKYDKSRPVILSFDLGDADMTSVWAWQQAGNEHSAVDFIEETGQEIGYFLSWAQEKGFIIGGIWLPHDAKQSHQSARKLTNNTIEKQVKAVYKQPGIVKVVPLTGIPIRLNAARSLFPRININDVTCSQGMMSLQHYQFEVDPDTKQRSRLPKHNWASHGASAFVEYTVQLREGYKKEKASDTEEIERDRPYPGVAQQHAQGWLR